MTAGRLIGDGDSIQNARAKSWIALSFIHAATVLQRDNQTHTMLGDSTRGTDNLIGQGQIEIGQSQIESGLSNNNKSEQKK